MVDLTDPATLKLVGGAIWALLGVAFLWIGRNRRRAARAAQALLPIIFDTEEREDREARKDERALREGPITRAEWNTLVQQVGALEGRIEGLGDVHCSHCPQQQASRGGRRNRW